jgi:hypothetical protein
MDDKMLCFETFGKLGFAYSTYRDSVPKVYLYELPAFNAVYQYFMSCRSCLLNLNKNQDICLSLFYNPYFDEFYTKLKTDVGMEKVSNNRLKFLKRYLLTYLADLIQNKIAMNYETGAKEHYIKHDIFNRSSELLKLINSN